MTLEEALAVQMHVDRLGYPTKAQRSALIAAREVIANRVQEVVARYTSPHPTSDSVGFTDEQVKS